MRVLLTSLAILAAGVPALAQERGQATASRAAGIDDPRSFVARTYAAYARAANRGPAEPTRAYSPRLARLAAGYARAWSGDDLAGPVDFDLWTNSQEWEISTPALTVEDGGPERRTVTARFRNYDQEVVNRFRFVRIGARWYLDDIVNGSGTGNDGWTFSALLAERP
jgi:hypothetical protein